jgi:hypothetical protein
VLVKATDVNGGNLPTVVVRLGSLTATTNAAGIARFTDVRSGRYEVSGELPGFMACPTRIAVTPETESEVQLMLRFGTIAMVGVFGKDGMMVGSYCEQQFAACPGDPASATVIKPPGAKEMEEHAQR